MAITQKNVDITSCEYRCVPSTTTNTDIAEMFAINDSDLAYLVFMKSVT